MASFWSLLLGAFLLIIPMTTMRYDSPEFFICLACLLVLISWFCIKMFASSRAIDNHETIMNESREDEIIRREFELVTATAWSRREQYRQNARVVPIVTRAQIARWALRALPPLKSFKGDETSDDSQLCECPICMEEFKHGELIQPFGLCVHQFHSSCLNSWLLSGNTTCPVCRKDLATTMCTAARVTL